jgi:mannose-6-phosphate isomerase-like protein (cupin superfamily)
MKGYVQDLEGLAVKNDKFRQVLYTAQHCQLVLMAIKPQGEIGAEVHTLDQFFRVEKGTGAAVLDGVRTAIRAGFAVLVPAGTRHNIVNTGRGPLKLYTLYAPPNHRDGVVHQTRAAAEADPEQFDGTTTERPTTANSRHPTEAARRGLQRGRDTRAAAGKRTGATTEEGVARDQAFDALSVPKGGRTVRTMAAPTRRYWPSANSQRAPGRPGGTKKASR